MFKKKLEQLIADLKQKTGLLLTISFGMFLFVLFFQPFSLYRFDFNNSLLFVAGLGTILFVSMALVRIIIPGFLRNKQTSQNNKDNNEILLPEYLKGFLIMVITSLSYIFYLRYVGNLGMNFFLVIKIIIICLVPPVILAIYDLVHDLRIQNELLVSEKKNIQKRIERFEEDILNKSIEFVSDNNTENLTLLISEVAFIRSADNYVEIVYKEGDDYRKKLIRNTLRNIENQIKQYSNFIRCHRICIVNLHFVEKIARSNNNNWLVIKDLDEQIPVSRQYLLKIKEAI